LLNELAATLDGEAKGAEEAKVTMLTATLRGIQ
jgi:hypothetical protein